ncbi:hypothetical protein [Desulfovibrio litoralis]|uniref:Autotransporter domain-containing protein n=1 Tax=Desulfovibrio litoralis DSM 11393 TaxID=1121455 RepID=A0A1M7RYS8_9BACT|nr:hypothetical protein [Desulfovibrio litoralis]SHN51489.1 hypothetical protein SAMN02745728_00354 [Desulfovibrio litoralis DSM 11393]
MLNLKYLNKIILCCLGVGLIIFASLLSVKPLKATTIDYDGNSALLQTAPAWVGSGRTFSLFPGTTASPLGANNIININFAAGTNPNYVFGGLSQAGSAYNNSVTMTLGTVAVDIYGGWSSSGNAYSNSVTMSGGTVTGHIYGGYSITGAAYSNSVTMSGGTAKQSIFGGYVNSGSKDAYNNNVTMIDGTVTWDIYGGYVYTGTGSAHDNSVEMHKGTVRDLYGGYAAFGTDGDVYNNSVTMSGDTSTARNVYGGNSYDGNAYSNRVNIIDGTVISAIYGGYVEDGGSAYDNSISMSGGAEYNLYGGYVNDGTGNAYNNSVTMSGGTDWNIYGGYVNDGTGEAYSNTVYMNKGIVNENIYGGYIDRGDGSAKDNSVYMNGGTVTKNIYGGFVHDGDGNANNNSVIVNDGIVNGLIYGGYIESGTGNANNNSVSISGGTVFQNIYGGYVESGNGSAINNIVNISGSPTFSPTFGTLPALFGGGTNSGFGDYRTGNTLNISNKGHRVDSIQNFENYNFLLPSDIQNNNVIMRADDIDLGIDANIGLGLGKNSYALNNLKPGDKIILLSSQNALVGNITNQGSTTYNGILTSYNFNFPINQSAHEIYITLDSLEVSPNAKTFSEGRAGEFAFINQGGDLVSKQGLQSAIDVTQRSGIYHFGTMSVGSSRYETGSHVDIDGFSLVSGLSAGSQLCFGRLVVGAFLEVGQGNYDSYNSFTATAIEGNGNTTYYGGGILAHYELKDEGQPSFAYIDFSARLGRADIDFSTNDLADITVKYDSASRYYGLHTGLGYIWQINKETSLDVSTKYLWTLQEGDSVDILGDELKFHDTYSQRWRNGVRLNYKLENNATPYIGASYEYEFDGEVKASTKIGNVNTPSLKGGTGIGELGIIIKPMINHDFSVDLGVQGYTGVREGVSGSLQMKYEF